MSAAADTASPKSAAHAVRPLYWSVRRELWENRAVYLAPLAVAAVIVAAFTYASHGLVHGLQVASGLAPALQVQVTAHGVTTVKDPRQMARFALMLPYFGSCAAILGTAVVVGVFYSLGALYGERRDRSVLFWKSLPVSDTTTVLSKAAVPFLLLPAIAIVVIFALQLLLLAISAVVLAANGLSFGLLWSRLELPVIWALFPYAVVTSAIWWAPVIGWLLLVSAWAKRMTFVWAVAPPLAVSLFERLAFGTGYAWRFVKSRITGGDIAFGPHPEHSLPTLDQFRPLQFLADPGVWGGLLVFAGLLAACVWLRRRRDPI